MDRIGIESDLVQLLLQSLVEMGMAVSDRYDSVAAIEISVFISFFIFISRPNLSLNGLLISVLTNFNIKRWMGVISFEEAKVL